MPTMRQTGINPQTEQKLSGTKRPSSSNNSSSECGLFIPIRTPSALLARDPHHLSSSLEVSLESIQNLRSTIAECVVLDPYIGHGGRAVEIREGVTKFCCCCVASSSSSPPPDDDDESNDDHRPPAITVGAVTALDLYAQTLLMKRIYSSDMNNPNPLEYISTGSVALDQLLLPSNEYHTFDEGYWNNLSAPFHIPNFDCYNNDAIPTHNNTTSSSSSANGGVPFGQITEISGKTSSGKTQLALTITAHALIVNNLQVKYLIAGGGGGSSRMAISRRLLSVCMAVAKAHLLMTIQGETNDESTINIDKEAKSLALKCMERVTIATVQDAYVLLGSLVQIENEELSYRSTNNNDESASAASSSLLKNCMDNHDHHKGTLVVIDSISGCLGHHIYSDLTVGASLSNQVSLTLRRMTRSYDGHFDSSSSSVVMDNHHHHSVDRLWQQQQQHPPRRFAVVVINGTVGKGANDSSISTSEVGGNGMTSYSSFSSSHKPAMGRYWQGGDMGLWLEEEDDDDGIVPGVGNSNSHAMSSLFYDGNVPGLSRSSEKVVTATLQWHYGKSLGGVNGSSCLRGEQGDGRQARFVIQAGGVADV